MRVNKKEESKGKVQDCTIVYFDGDFKKRLVEQRKLEDEMIRKFGKNKPMDFRYKICVGDNCIYAEHVSERELINR